MMLLTLQPLPTNGIFAILKIKSALCDETPCISDLGQYTYWLFNQLSKAYHLLRIKEAFLKACRLARRTAETFLKYSNRSLQFFNQPTQSTFKGPEAKVKGKAEKMAIEKKNVHS